MTLDARLQGKYCFEFYRCNRGKEFLKHEASQAFQTWYIKHEVQMASKSSDLALLIFEIILSFFIMFHRHAWMKWQMIRIFLATIEMVLYHYYYFLIWSFIHIWHSVNSYPTCRQRGGKILLEGWWRIKNEETSPYNIGAFTELKAFTNDMPSLDYE